MSTSSMNDCSLLVAIMYTCRLGHCERKRARAVREWRAAADRIESATSSRHRQHEPRLVAAEHLLGLEGPPFARAARRAHL